MVTPEQRTLKIQRRAEVGKDQLRKGNTCLSSFQEQFPLVLSFPSPSPQNKRSRATEDEVVTTTPDRVSPQSRNQICSAHDRQGEKKEALYARSQNHKFRGRTELTTIKTTTRRTEVRPSPFY